MTDPHLSIAATWSDADLLEVELFRFLAWAGAERVYTTRDDLRSFAKGLVAVSDGASTAALDAGQPDLGFASCRVFEYSLSRQLAMDVRIGHAGGNSINRPDHAREVRLTIPVERGQLARFASEIQHLVMRETGTATLPVSENWP